MNFVCRNGIVRALRNCINQELRSRSVHSVVYNLNTKNYIKPVTSLTNVSYLSIRYKSNKLKGFDSDDEQEVFDENDSSLSKDSKVIKFKTTSLRTDAILKSALGVSRNKIEEIFYESKIRVNGKKITKKSQSIKLGNEIDIIKIVSPHNPDHLYVSRIEVLNLVPKEEHIAVTVRRFKNLLIENYEDDPYKNTNTTNSE